MGGENASFCCASEVGADLNLAASTVSHHLKELRQAGLMRFAVPGQVAASVVGLALWLTGLLVSGGLAR